MSVSTHCVVYGCPNKGSKTSAFNSTLKEVTFHTFPKKDSSPHLYNKWIENINRDNFTPLKGSVLCSIHFTEDNFECSSSLTTSLSSKRMLLPSAVPTLYMGKPPSNVMIKKSIKSADSAREKKKNVSYVQKTNVPGLGYKSLRTICHKSIELEMPPPRPGFVNIGIQCEMGKETYRSQPGVVKEKEMKVMQIEDLISSGGSSSSSESDDSYHVTSTGVESETSRSSVDVNEDDDEIVAPSSTSKDDTTGDSNNGPCKCGSCPPMTGEDENQCCKDFGLTLKIKTDVGYKCITLHKSFDFIVLNVHALNMSRHCMILNSTSLDAKLELKNRLTNRLWRHIAYKQFINWINSWISLGHNSVRAIPACVINQIRNKYPETNNLYNHDFLAGKRGFEPDYFD